MILEEKNIKWILEFCLIKPCFKGSGGYIPKNPVKRSEGQINYWNCGAIQPKIRLDITFEVCIRTMCYNAGRICVENSRSNYPYIGRKNHNLEKFSNIFTYYYTWCIGNKFQLGNYFAVLLMLHIRKRRLVLALL